MEVRKQSAKSEMNHLNMSASAFVKGNDSIVYPTLDSSSTNYHIRDTISNLFRRKSYI